jgi:hypothetical protein
MAAEFIATWGIPPGDEKEPESEAPGQVAPEPVDAAPLPLFPFADNVILDERDPLICAEMEKALLRASKHSYDQVRKLVLERDHWKCTYPGCNARRELHVHHLEFRSRGGGHEPWNLTTLCHFHHALLHNGHIRVKGRAPHELEWTPPKLTQKVLERRRNHRATWVGELEVREWPRPRSNPEPALVPA